MTRNRYSPQTDSGAKYYSASTASGLGPVHKHQTKNLKHNTVYAQTNLHQLLNSPWREIGRWSFPQPTPRVDSR